MGLTGCPAAGLTGGSQAWSHGPLSIGRRARRLGDWATGRVEERTLDDDGADKWKKWKGSMHLSACRRGRGRGLGARGVIVVRCFGGTSSISSLVAKCHDATTSIVAVRRAIETAGTGFLALQ